MQKVPASNQVQQLSTALTQALIRKEEAQASLDEANKSIVAIRNVLAGVQLGQELQKEVAAEAQMPQAEPTTK